MIGTKKHGTRNAYNKGCRCKKCTDANTAYRYAMRQVGRWDMPITSLIAVDNHASMDGGRRLIPAKVVAEAIFNLAKDLKIETLKVLWKYQQKAKVR